MRQFEKKIFMVFLSGLFLLSLAAPGFSQNRSQTFNLSPFIGLYEFDNRQNLDNNPYYGLRAGYNFTKIIGLEAMIGWVPTETDSSAVTDRNVIVYRYGFDALFHFMPDSVLVPFITAGVGSIYIDSPSGMSNYSRKMLGFGAGIKYFINDMMALRGDFRQTIFPQKDEFPGDHYRINREFTIGVTFQIGGEKKEKKAVEAKPKVAEIPRVLIVLEDNHFEFDKSTITKQGEVILDEHIKILNTNPKTKVRIAGYTSAKGTQEYNQKLSERRAEAVQGYLVKGYIAKDRLTTIGYGEMRPAEYEPLPEKIESKEAKANMRVLFEVIVK